MAMIARWKSFVESKSRVRNSLGYIRTSEACDSSDDVCSCESGEACE